jgi:hypothetical protein
MVATSACHILTFNDKAPSQRDTSPMRTMDRPLPLASDYQYLENQMIKYWQQNITL